MSLPFKAAILGRPECLYGIYMGSWDRNSGFDVCRANAYPGELSLHPGRTSCSKQIVTSARNNPISKDPCVSLLTLQDLLYSLEADIKCCCLILPPCWKLHTQLCLWQLFGSCEVLIWDFSLALAFKGKINIKRTPYKGWQRWLRGWKCLLSKWGPEL